MNMHDLNWKTWGIVLALAMGTTFEVLKRIPSSQVWEKENFHAPLVKPYSAHTARGTRAGMMKYRPQPPAFLPATPPRQAAVKPSVPAVPPEMTKEQLAKLVAESQPTKAEAGKKGDEEFEMVLDPKTGKMVKKKKKKKVAKKKEEKKKEEPAKKSEEKVADEDEDTDSTENDIDNAITASLNTGKLAPMPKNKADDPFASAEDWIKKLLNRPNLAETNRFIDHYRKNLVTTEVYYKVTTMMLEDSRPEMKKLGIHAAAAVANPRSFMLLANAAQNSRNDSSVKQKADEALKSYTQLARLGVLRQVLSSGSPAYSQLKAANLVEASAKQYLGTQTSTTTNPNNNNNTPPPQPAQARVQATTTFKSFVEVLGNLTRTATDPGVKAAAGQTLATLTDLLGMGTPTAVAQQTPQQ